MAEPAQRLFFALWPCGDAIPGIMQWVHDAHALCGGRAMRPDTLHLTLAFLGATPADRVDELVRAAPAWPLARGTVVLSRFGRFAGPKVVWAGPSENDSPCLDWLRAIHGDLWGRLRRLGWPPPESAFHPHVSLLRKAGPGEVGTLHRPALAWVPGECVLVASRPAHAGSYYRVLARLPWKEA